MVSMPPRVLSRAMVSLIIGDWSFLNGDIAGFPSLVHSRLLVHPDRYHLGEGIANAAKKMINRRGCWYVAQVLPGAGLGWST